MDFKLDNIPIPDIWDIKSVVTKVKNVVLNYTEMEAKVHEATDNEPWGASSTLMQEIAQGTFNYQYFNEIMPAIYRRFTEKEAKYWRQIYKALVLLEYLVKNGAERVVDDARSHIASVKMLRNFHYIDEKARDQGINVRNRAKEITELLSDIDKIKAERKKAKQTRSKYTGVSSETSMGYGSSGSRYGGFGSESGGYGRSSGGYHDEGSGNYDDFDSQTERSERAERRQNTESPQPAKSSVDETRKGPTLSSTMSKEADLFDFGDGPSNKSTVSGGANKVLDDEWGNMESATSGADEFDDFQSAPTPNTSVQYSEQKTTAFSLFDSSVPTAKPLAFSPTTSMAPTTPAKTSETANLFDLLDSTSVPQSFTPPIAAQPVTSSPMNGLPPPLSTSTQSSKPDSSTTINLKPGDIWASNLVSLDLGKPAETKPVAGPSMASLAQNSASAAWNNFNRPASTTPTTQGAGTQKKLTQDFDDLLL